MTGMIESFMNIGRTSAAVTTIKGTIFVAGGMCPNNTLHYSVEKLDTSVEGAQ